MRVAHVTCLYPPEHLGGAPQQCRQIAIQQARDGLEVAVFSGALVPGAPMLQVTRVVQDGLPVTRIVTTAAFPEGEERNWRHPAIEPAFSDFLGEQRPDVVHFHSIQSLGASLLEPAHRAGARIVVTMHDLWWICARQFCVDRRFSPCIPAVTEGSCACQRGAAELARRRDYLDRMLAHADRILAPSEALLDRLRASGVPGDLRVDPNGVPPMAGPATRRSTGPGSRLRLLFMGGSNPMKGISVLVRALRLLTEAGVDYEADLYGIDPFAYATTAALGGLPVRAHKSFPPYRLDEVLGGCDVLLLPSVMFESSSRAVREALVRGIPVVATETGGPEEVVEPGVNGLLVPPGDPGSLGAAVARLASDPGLLKRLTGAGVRGAVPTPEVQAAALEAQYRELSKHPVASPAPVTRPRRVLFLAGIEGAPLRYRVHNPMEQLRLHGVESVLRGYADPRADADLEAADVVVVYRSPATRQLLAFISRARAAGRAVFFDVDDLIFDPDLARDLPTLSGLPAAARELWVDGVRRYRATLDACGRGIASTPEIARAMEAMGIPARVHANGVGTTLAVCSEEARRRRSGRLLGAGDPFVIGYFSGTDTHDADLAHVGPQLAAFLGAHPEARLVLGGPLRIPSELEPHRARVESSGFAPWTRHCHRLAELDLNLAPLIGGTFNEAKSSIKWSEAALVDVPTLATASAPFRASIEDGVSGLLARDPDEFGARLEEAIADRDRLARIGRRARLRAYRDGSPWLLGEALLRILSESLPATAAAAATGGGEAWPSEVSVTALEPAGLWPGLQAGFERTAPGELVGEQRVALDLPDAGPLRRVDVRLATYGEVPSGGVTLRVMDARGGVRRAVELGPQALADSAWAAFDIQPALQLQRGARAELHAQPEVRISPWVGAGGRRWVGGRERPGAVVARTYHEPPVPPDFAEPGSGEPSRPRRARASEWRVATGFLGLVGRQATYILRTEGPVKGVRRLSHAVTRRLRERLILGRGR